MGFGHYWWGFMIGIVAANADARYREQRINQWNNNFALRQYASLEFRKAYSNAQMEPRFNR